MLTYNMRLAVKSFQRNPGLTALMIGAIALGIAACVITMTLYHAMSGNPIWWKNDRLFAVTMDNWDPNRPLDPAHPQLPPPQLTYRDALYLGDSKIPSHHVIMHRNRAVLTGGMAQARPQPITTRMTTADFFAMFDVPFLYGGPWGAAADRGPEPVIVLSKQENETLFGGSNSVGRSIRWNDHEFRIVGVLDDWSPRPKFYDLNNSAFLPPEDTFIPFGWTAALQMIPNSGNHQCWRLEAMLTFEDYLNADCVWLQMWVELPDARSRERMQAYMDTYWAAQRAAGRFQRPRNNRLTPVSQWLVDNGVVGNDNRMLVGLAFAFLAVCLINTVGLLLAKFLNGAPLTGVRRALGASRRQIFIQHLVETGVLAGAGALLGLVVAALGLRGLRGLFGSAAEFGAPGYQALTHLDAYSVMVAVVLSVVAALTAGLYPAWRVACVAPAIYLKSQ
jgi:putative ABC transport system permease protein